MPRTTSLSQRQAIEVAAGEDAFAQCSVLFMGKATVILRCAGFTILTDLSTLPRMVHAPFQNGKAGEPLPPLDLVVLSHLDEGCFGCIAEENLDRRLPIYTTNRAARALRRRGFLRAYGLGEWETATIIKEEAMLILTAAPGCPRAGVMRWFQPPAMNSMLEFKTRNRNSLFNVYLGCDTQPSDSILKRLPKYAASDLALLQIGGEGGCAVRQAGLSDRVFYLRQGEAISLPIVNQEMATEARRHGVGK